LQPGEEKREKRTEKMARTVGGKKAKSAIFWKKGEVAM